MRTTKVFFLIVLAIFLFALALKEGNMGNDNPSITPPYPTYTPYPTSTPYPTATPYPIPIGPFTRGEKAHEFCDVWCGWILSSILISVICSTIFLVIYIDYYSRKMKVELEKELAKNSLVEAIRQLRQTERLVPVNRERPNGSLIKL